MADFPKRIGPIALTAAPVTLYVTPPDRTFTLRNIHVCNESALTAHFTMSIGVDAAGTRIYRNVELEGNGGAFDWSGYMPLDPNELLEAFADIASALTITISGVETT